MITASNIHHMSLQFGLDSVVNDHRPERTGTDEFDEFTMTALAGFDSVVDDHSPVRTGTVCTASFHILITVIGSGILSLPWATAQLGWIIGPAVMLLFAIVTYCTSTLLTDCYPSGDESNGQTNHTYMAVVRSNLGGIKCRMFKVVYYTNLFGVAIGYTMASSASMTEILRSICFRNNGSEKNPCHVKLHPPLIVLGVIQVIFSQIPDPDQLWILNIVTALASFIYSTIGLGLSIGKVAETGKFRGSLTGFGTGKVTATEKLWRSFLALGDIAFAYNFSSLLIEIQDTLRSPPPQAETMKKASLITLGVTALLYNLWGCFGYAAFGDSSPANFLAGFGSYKPYWPLDIANAAVVIHLIGSYQVHCQPLFAFVEKTAAQNFPDSKFITKDFKVPIPDSRTYDLNLFRLVWRTIFVIITTVIAMIFPWFNQAVSFLGAWGFWPLAVYFPVEIYIVQKNISKRSSEWIWLQILSFACFVITIAAAAGSIAGIVLRLK